MAVKSKQEILSSIKNIFGTDTDLTAEQITLIEDISDTVDAAASKEGDADWKAKYEENDKMWKDRYTQRFFSPEPETPTAASLVKEQEHENKGPSSFDELFREVK